MKNKLIDPPKAKQLDQLHRQQQLQMIFDSLPVMIWYKDGHNKIIRCNKLAAAVRGLTIEQMENHYTEEIYPDEAANYLADDLEVINSGEQKLGIVELHQTASGEKIWVRTDKIPYTDNEGEVIGVIVIALDITQLKRTEEELVRSISLLQAAFESTADGLLVVNREGKIIRFNRKFQDMWGVSDETLASGDDEQAVLAILDQLKDPEIFFDKVKELYNQPEIASYDFLEFKDGRVFERFSQPQWIEGKSVGRVWSFRDVSEQKWAERFLRTRHNVTTILAEAPSLAEVAKNILHTIGENLQWEVGLLWIVDATTAQLSCVDSWHMPLTPFNELVTNAKQKKFAFDIATPEHILATKKSIFLLRTIRDLKIKPVTRSLNGQNMPLGNYGFPIMHEGKILGVIEFFSRDNRPPSEPLHKMMFDIGHQIGQYMERKQAEEQLRSSSEQLRRVFIHLQSIREEERTNIAREIHDELGQNLTALGLDITWLQNRLPDNDKALLDKTKTISNLVDTIIRSVQRISTELRPSILDNLGLIAAIQWQLQEFINRTNIDCKLKNRVGSISFDQARATAVFRIFQESLTNIARHANATKVSINLSLKDGNLLMEIKDNGCGITSQQIKGLTSLGVIGMQERAMALGGGVIISGTTGKGTIVRVKMPTKPIDPDLY